MWGDDGLWPGPISIDDSRLTNHQLHIEFRGRVGALPLQHLREFIATQREVAIDARLTSHKLVMDLLMLGCVRVGIDLWAEDKEIALGHAVSEQLMLTVWLPSETDLTYLTDTLFPRLEEVVSIAPEQVLLVSQRKGDLAFVMDRIPNHLRMRFLWWLAPDEGAEISLRSNHNIAGWAVDGARLVEGRR